MRSLIVLALLLFAGHAYANCPTVKTDCPSPTFNNLTVGGSFNPSSITTNSLTLGSTALTLGTGIGNTLGPLINFQGSGHPGFLLSDRLILQRSGTASATDFGDLQLNRTTTFNGGTSGQNNAALRILLTTGANDGSQEWGFSSTCNTNSTVATGLCVGGYQIVNRNASSNQRIWGAVIDANDLTDVASSTANSAHVGLELDMYANRADDATNVNSLGGTGSRVSINLVYARQSAADVTPTTFAHGIWFSEGSVGNQAGNPQDTLSYMESAIEFSANSQVQNVLDTRFAATPSATGIPVAAVTMAAGQTIDFDGSLSTRAAAAQRALTYNSGSTKLQYLNAGTEKFAVTDAGAAIIGNGPSLSNSSGALAFSTAGGIQSEVINAATAVNFVTLKGSATGADPLISVDGSDASRNLSLQGKGTGRVVSVSAMNISSGNTSFVQVNGSNSALPSVLASGTAGNLVLATSGALATNATTGFPIIPTSAGTPTGSAPAGALVADTTNSKICVSMGSGTWHCI